MKLADIPDGQAVFVDANRFVYATDFNSPIYSICRQRARTAGCSCFGNHASHPPGVQSLQNGQHWSSRSS